MAWLLLNQNFICRISCSYPHQIILLDWMLDKLSKKIKFPGQTVTAVADSLYSSSSSSLRELDQTTTHFASSPPYLPHPPTHSTATVAPLDLTTTTDSVSRQSETYSNNNNNSQKNDNKYDSNIHEGEHQHGNNNANDGNNSAAVAFSQVSLVVLYYVCAYDTHTLQMIKILLLQFLYYLFFFCLLFFELVWW